MDLSYDNSTTSDQQFIITRQEDVVKGALKASGILDVTTKEENESFGSVASSIGGEETADIDDNWLSDLMVVNPSATNNNMEKQAMIGLEHGSIFTPRNNDNEISTSLLDKYLTQKNLQQQQMHHQQSGEVDNEEFDSYFNELFPDLAL